MAVTPDERTFRDHVAGGRFQGGADRGDWWLVNERWPNPLIAVAAAGRPGVPSALVLRFDLTNYPAAGPTAQPWDAERDAGLAHDLWPAGSGRIATVFNPQWMPSPGVHALYHPIDRLAIVGHDNWRTQDPGSVWDPSRMDIVDYLKVVHELLHSAAYSGIRRAA